MVFSTRKQKKKNKKKKKVWNLRFPVRNFHKMRPWSAVAHISTQEHDGNDLHSYVKHRIDFYYPVFSLDSEKINLMIHDQLSSNQRRSIVIFLYCKCAYHQFLVGT
jgi:hypothetical protein